MVLTKSQHNKSIYFFYQIEYEKKFFQNAAIADGKEDFSDLAPNQRRKKLIQRVEDLQTKVAQESAARDGLMKMKGVYENNPALGDPMTIEGNFKQIN